MASETSSRAGIFKKLVAEAQSFTTVAILFQRLIYQTNLPKVIKALLLIFTAIRFFDIIPHISYADIKKSSNETDFFSLRHGSCEDMT